MRLLQSCALKVSSYSNVLFKLFITKLPVLRETVKMPQSEHIYTHVDTFALISFDKQVGRTIASDSMAGLS